MLTRLIRPALLAVLIVASPVGTVRGAVDPALIVLDAKVSGASAGVTALKVKVQVVDAQLAQLFAENEEALLQLGDARRRDLESVLLKCALENPLKCVPPAYLSSALDPKCSVTIPVRRSGPTSRAAHSHDLGAACPLQELLSVVVADRVLAEAGGLPRDYASADRHLAAAEAARLAGDGWTAFIEACAAFRQLACP